jgi:ribosomal protein S27E
MQLQCDVCNAVLAACGGGRNMMQGFNCADAAKVYGNAEHWSVHP